MKVKQTVNRIRPIHIICYIFSCIFFIALFFTNRWEHAFHVWVLPNPFAIGLTVNKLVLFLLNVSLFISILAPLQNEDERLEKIKNYGFIHTFIMALVMGLIMGLFLQANTSLLIYTAVVQVYYLLIFHICLYRDSAMIYMNKKEMIAYGLRINKRFKINYIQGAFWGIIIGVLSFNHRDDLVITGIFMVTGIFYLIKMIYMHWQN
jgi:hypothetical protein